jgi:diguanylate cyclase (GGDEF)-like protein
MRARELAEDDDVVRAMSDRDLKSLQRLLGPRDAVVLASGTRVGWQPEPVPSARVEVRSRSKPLGTIVSAAPGAAHVLATDDNSSGVPGDLLAVSQDGIVVAGPAGLTTAVAGLERVHLNDRSYIAAAVGLAGYSPPVKVIALADEEDAELSLAQFRRRLALAGVAALASIFLYTLALSRPLGKWFDEVAEVALQADVDPLTGIANRRGFDVALETELLRSARYGRPCSLLLTDLDDFKLVNDEHGHGVGDAVLIALTQRVQENLRATDIVARIGGEEFAVILPELDLDGALAAADRMRQALAADELITRQGREVRVTASFGVAVSDGTVPPSELLRLADDALYAAKRNGKNRVVAATGTAGTWASRAEDAVAPRGSAHPR